MRDGKRIVLVLSFLLVLMAAAVLILFPYEVPEEPEHEVSLSFWVSSGHHQERIQSWKNPEGLFYVFLPGYAQMDQVTAEADGGQIFIGDDPVTDGMPCGHFLLDTEYPFVYQVNETAYETGIIFVRSGGLPSLYIDVQSYSMDYIHMDKTHEESGVLRLYDANGAQLSEGKLESMKGRGNTSWDAEKKPYNFTLSEELDLLGMGAATRWILLAEGHNASAVRNKIVYDFAQAVEIPFSPDTQWVDLYLNGIYSGVYLLSERNEIHPERVDIPDENSFLVSMESERLLNAQKIPHVLTDAERAFRIRNASQDHQTLQLFLQSVESAILAEDGIDPVSGKHWREMIDMDSWVRKYLIEETFANPDGGSVSQYFYWNGSDPSGKLYAGPVWDYDFAMGGEGYWLGGHDAYYTMNCRDSRFSNYVSWFYPLYHTVDFYQHLTAVYEKEFLPKLQELIDVRLGEYGAYLSEASRVSQIRWSQPSEAMNQELDFIGEFLERRIRFLTDVWVAKTPYYTVHMDIGKYYDGHFAVQPGERIPEIPDYVLSDGIGWYTTDTEEPFDITQPIYQDVSIYYKPAETVIPAMTVLPIAGTALALILLIILDFRRTVQNRRSKHESAKVN